MYVALKAEECVLGVGRWSQELTREQPGAFWHMDAPINAFLSLDTHTHSMCDRLCVCHAHLGVSRRHVLFSQSRARSRLVHSKNIYVMYVAPDLVWKKKKKNNHINQFPSLCLFVIWLGLFVTWAEPPCLLPLFPINSQGCVQTPQTLNRIGCQRDVSEFDKQPITLESWTTPLTEWRRGVTFY